MSFFKNALARHVKNRMNKRNRVKQFGSRHAYRRMKKSIGNNGRGASM